MLETVQLAIVHRGRFSLVAHTTRLQPSVADPPDVPFAEGRACALY
jgi:hypothetical protein